MKNCLVLAACVALAACAQSDAPPAAEGTGEAAATAAAEVMAADGKSPVGKYRITTGDGESFEEELRADGTYAITKGGQVTETGTWAQKAPDNFCNTKSHEGATETCHAEKIEDGVWLSTDPEGRTATVERIES